MITRQRYLELAAYARENDLSDEWLAAELGRIVLTVHRRELSRAIGRQVGRKLGPCPATTLGEAIRWVRRQAKKLGLEHGEDIDWREAAWSTGAGATGSATGRAA